MIQINRLVITWPWIKTLPNRNYERKFPGVFFFSLKWPK